GSKQVSRTPRSWLLSIVLSRHVLTADAHARIHAKGGASYETVFRYEPERAAFDILGNKDLTRKSPAPVATAAAPTSAKYSPTSRFAPDGKSKRMSHAIRIPAITP